MFAKRMFQVVLFVILASVILCSCGGGAAWDFGEGRAYGNTAGNSMNGGVMVSGGEGAYYYSVLPNATGYAGGIFCVKDGVTTPIAEGFALKLNNYKDEWIYFMSDQAAFCRVRTDGSEKQEFDLRFAISTCIILNDSILFSGNDAQGNYNIYAMDLEGKNIQPLIRNPNNQMSIGIMAIDNDYLYYYDSKKEKVHRAAYNGNDDEVIFSGDVVKMVAHQNSLYLMIGKTQPNGEKEYSLQRVDTNGANAETIADSIEGFNFVQDSVVYLKKETDMAIQQDTEKSAYYSLYQCGLDGKNPQRYSDVLSEQISIYTINDTPMLYSWFNGDITTLE